MQLIRSSIPKSAQIASPYAFQATLKIRSDIDCNSISIALQRYRKHRQSLVGRFGYRG
jgi:hypothetical protein